MNMTLIDSINYTAAVYSCLGAYLRSTLTEHLNIHAVIKSANHVATVKLITYSILKNWSGQLW